MAEAHARAVPAYQPGAMSLKPIQLPQRRMRSLKSLTEATKSFVEEDPEKETKMNVAWGIEMARSGFELSMFV